MEDFREKQAKNALSSGRSLLKKADPLFFRCPKPAVLPFNWAVPCSTRYFPSFIKMPSRKRAIDGALSSFIIGSISKTAFPRIFCLLGFFGLTANPVASEPLTFPRKLSNKAGRFPVGHLGRFRSRTTRTTGLTAFVRNFYGLFDVRNHWGGFCGIFRGLRAS